MQSKNAEYQIRSRKKHLFMKSAVKRERVASQIGELVLAAMRLGESDVRVEALIFRAVQNS